MEVLHNTCANGEEDVEDMKNIACLHALHSKSVAAQIKPYGKALYRWRCCTALVLMEKKM